MLEPMRVLFLLDIGVDRESLGVLFTSQNQREKEITFKQIPRSNSEDMTDLDRENF